MRARRRSLGLGQMELAELADVSERFVRSLEQNKATVRLDKLRPSSTRWVWSCVLNPAGASAHEPARRSRADGGAGAAEDLDEIGFDARRVQDLSRVMRHRARTMAATAAR